ncbi:MAG: hypothetical protein WCT37_02765 [Patescibacteria group bacterium]
MLPGIELSNHHCLRFVAASGALGFDGRGWPHEWPLRWLGLLRPELLTVVLKTLTLQPRAGNGDGLGLLNTVRLLPNGVVNAVGLRNPGISAWLENSAPHLPPAVPTIISLAGTGQELIQLAQIIQDELTRHLAGKQIVGLEINLSCPNVHGADSIIPADIREIFRQVKAAASLPLLVKLGYDPEKYYLAVAKELAGIAEAVSLNSVPWRYLYPDTVSPLARFGSGGVSGRAAQKYTWQMARDLSPILPVIGASVSSYGDLWELYELGASAIAFGSIFILRPWAPTRFVRRWQKEHQ